MAENIYALYKGEKKLAEGTAKQIAKEMNFCVEHVYKLANPYYLKDAKPNWRRVVLVEERRTEYALYKGDDFLDVGTAEELAEARGVKPSTIRFMASPAHKHRRGTGKAVYAERIEDDEGEK